MKSLVILTATIKPKLQTNLVRNNSQSRLNDYLKSIHFYSNLTCNDVDFIVVENSKSIIDIEKNFQYTKNTKFIQAPEDKYSLAGGKSSGEFEMLKHLQKNGYFEEYDFIWKITGRLKVKNIDTLIAAQKMDIFVYRFTEGHSCDSRIFGMRRDLFVKFLEGNVRFQENEFILRNALQNTFKSIENYLTVFIARENEVGRSVQMNWIAPFYSGYGASIGKKLDSRKAIFHYYSSRVFRKFAIKILGSFLP